MTDVERPTTGEYSVRFMFHGTEYKAGCDLSDDKEWNGKLIDGVAMSVKQQLVKVIG